MPDAQARADLVAYLARAWYQDAATTRGGGTGEVLAEDRRTDGSPLSREVVVFRPLSIRDDLGPAERRGPGATRYS
jgi:hypothetical protein